MRTLITLVVSVFMVSPIHAQLSEEENNKLSARIHAAGGIVTRSSNLPGVPIVSVSWGDKQFPVEILKELAKLKELKRLNFSYTTHSDEILSSLTEMEHVEVIDMIGSKVTGVGFNHLTKLKKLNTLFLQNANINDPGLREIAKLPGLTYLAVSDNPAITDAGFAELARSPLLCNLDFRYTKVSDKGLEPFKNRAYKGMMVLDLPDQAKTDLGLKLYFEIVRSKTYLNCSHWKITDQGLMNLNLTEMREIILSYTLITDDSLKLLRQSRDLITLNVSKTAITGSGIEHLTLLPYLRELDLSLCRLDVASVKQIVKLKSLETLHIGSTALPESVLADLLQMKNLKVLNISGMELTKEGYERLAQYKHLSALSMTIKKDQKDLLRELRAALPKCQFR